MKAASLAAAFVLALSTAAPAQASLRHAGADVFTALADLTRPAHLRKSSASLKSIADHTDGDKSSSSASLGYVSEGVSWVLKDILGGGSSSSTGSAGDDAGLSIDPIHAVVNDDSPTSADLVKRLNDLNSAPVNDQSAFTTYADDGDDSPSGVPLPPGQLAPGTFAPFNPPSIPLAVKSPYLSAWLPSGNYDKATPPNYVGNGGYLAGQWASFWTSSYGADGGYRLGWTGYIRIDNTTYQWMGNGFGTLVRAGKNANQLSMTYTSTRSIFTFEAAGVRFNVTFMTPVWPNDYLRQSIPLSYMHFELDESSAAGRSVQMFTDIDERWATGHYYDYGTYPVNMQWVDNANGSSIYFVQRSNPETYHEFRQRAEWGSAMYAMRKRKGMSSRNNNNVVAQLEFLNTGKLSFDHNPVGGPDNSFGYAVDFDGKGGNDAVFAIGFVRTPYVSYIKAQKKSNNSETPSSYLEDRYGYWMSKYPNFSDLVAFFLNDYENALQHCIKLDQQIDQDSVEAVGGGELGEKYSAITQLSVRHSLASLEITVPYVSSKKTYNTSDVIVFLKEISSNGDMQTVDVFTPQFPLITYLNPEMLRDIMRPIFEYTESGLYPNKWCVHDLGTYPTAFGHNDGKDEPMQVEESGNMILLALHYAQLVGPKTAKPWLSSHYRIMQQWAEFLITDSLVPALQLSTDDFAGTLANQSNLAIKGIEGIAAMGYIADMLGNTKDSKMYQNISQTYIQSYYGYAINKNNTHVKLAYQTDDSWGTLYNLMFDRLLNLRLVAKDIYTKQDAFYPTKVQQFGTPLDSRYVWAKSDWQMWASATAANLTTRDFWINELYKFQSNRRTDAPMIDLYNAVTGDFPKQPATPVVLFLARPVVGGHFIHLTMQKANKANNVTDYQYGAPIKKTKDTSKSAQSVIDDAMLQLNDGKGDNDDSIDNDNDNNETNDNDSDKSAKQFGKGQVMRKMGKQQVFNANPL